MWDSDKLNAEALALFERSLDETSESREAWIKAQAGDDTALCDKALSYLSRDASAGAAFQTGGAFHDTLDDTAIPEKIGAYKITGLIGRGGMGSVYRGERASGDFDHDVAIKVVRPGAMSAKLVARFETERQTLAQLSHPHIARLYDGGTLDNGAPYIVMEFIDGLPITEWADTHKLSRDERLSLFKAACSAVSYAHQNLIIHRDITPSNVLVDASGQVKLIDFGIAKPFDEDAAVTDMAYSLASLSFTPGFAAPERSKGAGANTLSDIYSLGKLLGNLTETSQRDADLSAIIAKATELTPEKRYSSADALIDDLNNFKNGFPVDAVPPSKTYRVRKFVRRQRLFLGLTASTLVASGFFIANYWRAEVAGNFADARLSETRQMTNFLLTELPDDLRSIPGTLPIQKKVIDVSGSYLEILKEAAGSNPDVLYDYAMGHSQMGHILTANNLANLANEPEEGVKHYEESLRVLLQLDSQKYQSPGFLMSLANIQQSLSFAKSYHFGQAREAAKLNQDANAVYTRVLDKDPKNSRAQLGLAISDSISHYNLNTDEGFPRSDKNRKQINEFRQKVERLLKENPGDWRFESSYALVLVRDAETSYFSWVDGGGNVLHDSIKTEYQNALTSMQSAYEIFKTIHQRDPKSTDHIYRFADMLRSVIRVQIVDTNWQPNLPEIIDQLSKNGKAYTEAELRQIAVNDPIMATDRDIGDYLFKEMDYLETVLDEIAPFEDKTFSHIRAMFYVLRQKAALLLRYRLDFQSATEELDIAKIMVDGFKKANPDFRNAYMEDAIVHTERAYLYTLKSKIIGGNYEAEICGHLTQAKSLWIYGEERWGKIVDYDRDVQITNRMIKKSGCKV